MAQTVEVPDGIQEFLLGILYFLISLVVLTIFFYAFVRIRMAQRRKKWAAAPQDMVILHQLPRGRFAPSISPFALKLETYLRMAKITYQVDFDEPFGPSGKTPWITFNGREISDSQMCQEFLGHHFNTNFCDHLSAEDKAYGRAFQIMMEEHFYWAIPLWRFVYAKFRDWCTIMELPWYKYITIIWMSCGVKRRAECQGLGCFSEETVMDMTERDLKALSHFLGNKMFLFGDEASEFDCAIFGILVQPLWCMPGSPYQPMLYGELANLREYCLRIKERFWPDWNLCLYPPKANDMNVSTV